MLRQTNGKRNAYPARGGADILLDGKPTGCRTRSDILVRDAHSNRGHLVRVPESSWAFHVAIVDEAIARGCTAVLVIDHDTGRTYYTEMQTFLDQGQRFNYGRGDQIRLPLRMWRQKPGPAGDTTPAQPGAAPAAATVPQLEPQAAQMTLFGEVTR